MDYKGTIYGKVGGKYIPLSHTNEYVKIKEVRAMVEEELPEHSNYAAVRIKVLAKLDEMEATK